MRRTLALGLLAFLLLGAWTGSPSAEAKDKAPETSPLEKDFLAQYASDDGGARGKAVDLLADAPDAVKLELISTRVIPKEKRADVLSHAVAVLSRIKDEAVAAEMVAVAGRGPAAQRSLYVEAMAAMPWSGTVHRALLGLVKDREVWVRGMAAYALGEHHTVDALDPLLASLDDKAWQVQMAALGALPRISDKDALKTRAVPKLVEYLETSAGRAREDCADALRRITGRNLGKDPARWRAWIAGGDAAVKPKESEEGKKPGEGGDQPYANQPEKPHFYGMEVTSTRVVLILDVSMSMNDPIEIDKDRLRRETSRRAVTGDDAPKPGEKADADDVGYDIPWWRVKTKFDLAKYQTINLISRLDPDQNFELILFSTEAEPWMGGRLVPATQANKLKAIQLLESIKFDDKTNTWGALAAAFEMSASNTRSGGGNAPDEIYLVTDGEPSVGDILDKNQLTDAVLQLAKVHQMRVNVIAIGLNLSFLRKMAVGTGGVYKFF